MKKYLLGSIAIAALAGAAVAVAQTASPAPPSPAIVPVPPGTPFDIDHATRRQPQTRNGVVEKVRGHFAQLDTDRDGYLTRAETEAGHAKMKTMRVRKVGKLEGHGRNRDHGAMFDRLDANRDGSISRDEFASGHQQRRAMRGAHDGDGQPDKRGMHAMRGHGGGMRLGGHRFEQADTNRDARVSLQEATEAAVRHFDMADVNRDGSLTPDERQQMRVRMKEVHRVTRPS